MTATLFTNVRIFEGGEDGLEPVEVLVQGNRIKTVARGGQRIARNKAAEVIDGGGATLMPGLVNPHCHFTYNNATSIADITALPVEEHMLVTMRNLATYLDYGFTAVIGMASAKPRLELVARNAVDAGHYPGPRIRACTPEYTVTGGLGDDNRLDREIPSIGLICNGAEEFRRSIREQIREGVDIVKFNNSGDSLTMGGLPGDINPMTDDEVRTICETAHRLGRRVAAHAHADSASSSSTTPPSPARRPSTSWPGSPSGTGSRRPSPRVTTPRSKRPTGASPRTSPRPSATSASSRAAAAA
jgi:imidazolonepropionase-like amidohydrolase